ncbi:MAG: glycosyltransferase, partial [Pseudomonadota bacterium]
MEGYLLVLPALGAWALLLLLPWRPWSTREVLEAREDAAEEDLSDVTVLIPARNEATSIGTTLAALTGQGKGLRIIVVDDESDDGTAEVVAGVAGGDVTLLRGEPLPAGWAGKVWALQQGLARVNTPLTLLLDADIELRPGMIAALRYKMREDGLQFVSLMAALRMASFWERLLMPAFVYYFKLIYPFALANAPRFER